jgi:hypothetical protein
MPAFQTFYADIRSQTHNYPFVAAAGVRFFQANDITQSNVQNHSSIWQLANRE